MHGINNDENLTSLGIKFLIRYLSNNTNQISLFGEYLKVRESLHTQFIIWVNSLNHVDTRVISPRSEGFWIAYRPKVYQNQKYHQIAIPYYFKK